MVHFLHAHPARGDAQADSGVEEAALHRAEIPHRLRDGEAVEAEQDGYNRHWQAPIAELNPAVHAFQALTIRKWEEYLATSGGRVAEAR